MIRLLHWPVLITIFCIHHGHAQVEIYKMTASDGYRDTVIQQFTEPIQLDYKKTHITFSFKSESDSLQYKLDPFDDFPQQAGGCLTANYINLPGGAYTFRVMVAGHPETKDEIRFELTRAFWQAPWFIPAVIIYLLFVIGLVWFSVRTVRYRQQMRLQRVRNKIAADLHDEIGGTLANISLLMGLASTQPDKDTLNRIHQRVHQDSRDLILQMRGMLLAIHPGNDKAIDFFEKIRSSFSEALRIQNLESRFQLKVSEADTLTVEQQHNLFLVLKEIMTNAIKHARAKEMEFVLSQKEHWLMIRVSDDGIGFNPEMASDGYGLNNIRDRVKEISGKLEIQSGTSGTTYLIAVPLM